MLKTICGLAVAAAVIFSAPAFAASGTQRALEKLEPSTRMIEVCDIAVSARLAKETAYDKVDRLVADAAKDAVVGANAVTAKGAAFRNEGHWYGLSYACGLKPDHLSVKTLTYSVGAEIPESSWEKYGLWR